MLNLELDSGEQAMLAEILSGYLSDLRMEIGSTDQQDFREALKTQEVFITKLLLKLQQN